MTLNQEFIAQCLFRFDENLPRIEKCLNELTLEQVWQRPNKHSNSIANLILHLSGNITQYIISSLGKQEDIRKRDLEFTTEKEYSKEALLELISGTCTKAKEIMSQIEEEKLLLISHVQGFQFSGIGIMIHVIEHFSYHTGQIAFYTKLLKDNDLEFYKDFDLNIKNT